MEDKPEPVTGTAAGVPFTALPPAVPVAGPAPVVLTWHMMDAPCTDAAFAAALPIAQVPAWRVHLGMPLCGARMLDGGMGAVVELSRRDTIMAYLDPVVRQAVEEFPAALAKLRERLPMETGPIGLVGGSLGGTVALRVLTESPIPVAAAALVNPAVRARSVVELVETVTGTPYSWTNTSTKAADDLDFVAHAADIAARRPQPPLLLASGEQDFPALRTDAAELVDALREHYAEPEHVQISTVVDLSHPLAERPGLVPAPQIPTAIVVDRAVAAWFVQHLCGSPR